MDNRAAPAVSKSPAFSKRSAAYQRVAIIAADTGNLLRNRRELITRIAADRHQVTALVPAIGRGDEELVTALRRNAVFDLRTFGENASSHFMPSAGLEQTIAAQLAVLTPHVALISGSRVFGAAIRACRRQKGIRVVGLVNRLDSILPPLGKKPNWLAIRQLRQTLALTDALVCHNRDDAQILDRLGVLPPDRPVGLVPGAGVDLDHFAAEPLPALGTGFTVVMISRFDRRAGVLEFCAAADRVVAKSPNVRFVLAGLDSAGPDALSFDAVRRLSANVEVAGTLADVRTLIASAHLYVQATWGEGLPRTLLEAVSMGRPVIATDTPGCRDAIDVRINGVLVPPRDADALASTIESVLKRPDLMPAMARASRQKAVHRFDVRLVTAELMRVMGLARE